MLWYSLEAPHTFLCRNKKKYQCFRLKKVLYLELCNFNEQQLFGTIHTVFRCTLHHNPWHIIYLKLRDKNLIKFLEKKKKKWKPSLHSKVDFKLQSNSNTYKRFERLFLQTENSQFSLVLSNHSFNMTHLFKTYDSNQAYWFGIPK